MPEGTVNFNVLHRTCKALVFVCFIYISLTLVYYAKSMNFHLALKQNQQHQATAAGEVKSSARNLSSAGEQLNSTLVANKALEQCPDPSPLLGK